MLHLKRGTWLSAVPGALLLCTGVVQAKDIGGTISATLTITENSQLVDDVVCMVTGAPCIAIGAPNVTLNLNGFTMTGLADPQTPCTRAPVAREEGIEVNTQPGVTIQGPGLIRH